MKQLLLLLLVVFATKLQAKNYYVSATGNDASDGLTTATPWKSIAKVNSFTFAANDYILFKRGDIFFGSIKVNGNNLFFDSYGSGAKPIISGFTKLTTWVNDGGGIWHCNVPSASKDLIMVTINGSIQTLGRYPNESAVNAGYLTYSSFNSTTPSITGPSVSTTTNWTGAEVVIRKNHWILDRCEVTGHSAGTVNYTNPTGVINGPYPGKIGYGYFFQDDIRTLDQFGEWFLNKSTKNLSVYFGTNNPSAYIIQASAVDTIFNLGSKGYISINNIEIEGANKIAVYNKFGNTISVTNCKVNKSYNGIYLNTVNTSILIKNDTITNCLNIGVFGKSFSGGTVNISNNYIKNITLFAGMTGSGDANGLALMQDGDNGSVEYNRIDSVGYIGLDFKGNNTNVSYNHITNFCSIKDDGSGIYTSSDGGSTIHSNRIVSYNIINGGIGAINGTPNYATPGSTYDTHGIYMDEGANHVNIFNNTVSSLSQGVGIFLNFAKDLTIRNNTYFNVLKGLNMTRMPNKQLIRNISFSSNIIYPVLSNFFYWNGSLNYPTTVSIQEDIKAMFTKIDSNYYRSDASKPFYYFYHLSNGGAFTDGTPMSLPTWKTYLGQESKSITIPSGTMELKYNASSNPVIYAFSGLSKKDVYGIVYNNSVTIPAWSSKVLIANGTASTGNIKPSANAGPNQLISLPSNSILLTGSGTDLDGTITTYSWVKISGPVTLNIATPNTATTAVNNLVQGLYIFEFSVTDNSGAIGKDTVQVTVNAASNLAPKANAGTDKIIILPANSTSLIGAGTDADGTITNFAWVKISGPASGTIVSPGTATTGVSNLEQGIYQFGLTVTDNNGSIGKDTVQVTVRATSNQSPTANAGTDKTITLPINTISLNGTGTDVDGTIHTYAWVIISGPASGTIATPNTANTLVNNLIEGIYQYELTVTDNNGAYGTDTIQVTVNTAFNQAPTADAGNKKSIKLPTNTTTLSGSGTDVDGTISSYNWTKVAGPLLGFIANSNQAITEVTNLVQGIYRFELAVTDNNGAIGKDTVQVTVNSATNQAPVAKVGSSKKITETSTSITLSGSGEDVDGTISSYEWAKVSGPLPGTIVTAGEAITLVNNLVSGIYEFELTVTDDNGATGKDTLQVTVSVSLNQVPIANAGIDQTITLPGNTTSLNGIGTDSDGTISIYAWLKISGPAPGNIASANKANTEINQLIQGIYQFELTVTDNKGAIGKDTVKVTVNAVPNQAPLANAGADKTITLPINTINLNGAGIDTDGTISSYTWLKISGPEPGNIVSFNKANTEINQLIQGIYRFELTVTDDKGAIGKDTVQVTVNAVPNQAPIANAGTDKTITLPVNSISLIGAGTDTDGTISSYAWIKISGPEPGIIATANNANTAINNLVQGLYQFELTVTDNNGATGKDTVKVFVNAPINEQPLADAGADKTITLPVNITSLTGAGKDTDGTISNYTWVKIAGPAQGTIASANTASTAITNLIEGIYQFELTVTDNNGAIGRDTAQVSVNAASNLAPSANAGTDLIITLPLNAISLNGGGTDLDGSISSYRWIKITGPATGEIESMHASTTAVNYLIQGVYQFELTVTDNNGATGKDTVQVTVNAAAISNKVPVVNAGDDINIVLPTNSVSLKGIATDPDGTIVSYKWEVISGPTGYLFTTPNLGETKIENLFQGVYVIQFTAMDNSGAETRDSLSITVASPRLSNINSDSSSPNQFRVYPNPVKDIANININTINKNTKLSIVVMNASGKLVTGKEFVTTDKSTIYQLDMSTLTNGLYFITLRFDDGQVLSTKVLKNGSN